jgi:hypothetical protein
MADIFSTKLAALGFKLPDGHIAPSEEFVKEFEKRFNLTLPRDFRAFLVAHGGVRGLATCPMLEPTPFGTSTIIDSFYGFNEDEIAESTDIIEGAPVVIALGGEPLGRMHWLFCTEPYPGHVFVRDHYGRSAWTDDEFFKWPNLAPEIRHYLDLRRTGQLPKKPDELADVYLVARSFTDFIERLQPFKKNAS